MCTYIRDAGAGESKKAIGVVTFHDTQRGRGSGERQPRSAASCHQLQMEDLLSLLHVIVPDLHHEGLAPLVLQVTQVARDGAQVCLRRLGVELVDLAPAQRRPVEADILQKTRVPPLPVRIRPDEHRSRSWKGTKNSIFICRNSLCCMLESSAEQFMDFEMILSDDIFKYFNDGAIVERIHTFICPHTSG